MPIYFKEIFRHIMEQTSGKYQDKFGSSTTKTYSEKHKKTSRMCVKNDDRASAVIELYRVEGQKHYSVQEKNAIDQKLQLSSLSSPFAAPLAITVSMPLLCMVKSHSAKAYFCSLPQRRV